MRYLSTLLWIGTAAALLGPVACTDAKENAQVQSGVLARLDNDCLYRRDLPVALQKRPSAKAVSVYIEQWATRKLLAQEAQQDPSYDAAQLERQVEEYRECLLAQHRLNKVAEQCPLPAQEQIFDYYTAYQDQFLLRENIYRVRFVVVNRNQAQASQILTCMHRNDPKNEETLRALCHKSAVQFSLDPDKWWRWGEITSQSPLDLLRLKERQLKQGRVVQISNRQHTGYFKLLERKDVHKIAPFAFVQDQVKRMVVHREKIKAARQYKKELLAHAQRQSKLIVYETAQ